MAQGVTARVFRCFCDCSDLTEKEIQDIVMGHPDLAFTDSRVKQLFRAYMDKFHPPTRREQMCLKYLTCYEISEQLLRKPASDRLDFEMNFQLYENCPTYAWERILYNAIQDHTHPQKLEETLHQFMLELKRYFEDDTHNYYALFKEELMKKLQQT